MRILSYAGMAEVAALILLFLLLIPMNLYFCNPADDDECGKGKRAGSYGMPLMNDAVIPVLNLKLEPVSLQVPPAEPASREQDRLLSRGDRSVDSMRGVASWYGGRDGLDGLPTASGETFKAELFTAAHRTLDFGTRVRVTFLQTGKSVVVRINDRGPYVSGRIIDLSRAAAQEIGLLQYGIGLVDLDVME